MPKAERSFGKDQVEWLNAYDVGSQLLLLGKIIHGKYESFRPESLDKRALIKKLQKCIEILSA
jgi:hypothetical protein